MMTASRLLKVLSLSTSLVVSACAAESDSADDLAPVGDTTAVHLFAEHGAGRERALPSVVLDVVLDELREAMRAKPDVFAPLRMSADEAEDMLVFVAAS